MYPNAQAYLGVYGWESQTTSNVLGALTDAALVQAKAPGHEMTAGDIAWHIATAPLYMLSQVGFNLDPAQAQQPAKLSAVLIKETYDRISGEVKAQVAGASPEQLAKVYKVFGMMDWSCGQMLGVLLHHEIHHRGQLSVLMRQAGVVVPSIYGPTKETTAEDMKKMMEQQA